MSTTNTAVQMTRRAVWTVTAAATRPQPAVHVTRHPVVGGEGASVRIGDDPQPCIYVERAGGGWSVRVEGRSTTITLSAYGAEKALTMDLVQYLAYKAR